MSQVPTFPSLVLGKKDAKELVIYLAGFPDNETSSWGEVLDGLSGDNRIYALCLPGLGADGKGGMKKEFTTDPKAKGALVSKARMRQVKPETELGIPRPAGQERLPAPPKKFGSAKDVFAYQAEVDAQASASLTKEVYPNPELMSAAMDMPGREAPSRTKPSGLASTLR